MSAFTISETIHEKARDAVENFSWYDFIILCIMAVSAFHYYQVLETVDRLAAISIAVFIDLIHFSTFKSLLRERKPGWLFVLILFALIITGISFFFQFSFYRINARYLPIFDRIVFSAIVPFGITVISILKYLKMRDKDIKEKQTDEGAEGKPERLPGETRTAYRDRLYLLETLEGDGKEKGKGNPEQKEKEKQKQKEMENAKGNGNDLLFLSEAKQKEKQKESNPEEKAKANPGPEAKGKFEQKETEVKEGSIAHNRILLNKGICPTCGKDFSHRPNPLKAATGHFSRAHGSSGKKKEGSL